MSARFPIPVPRDSGLFPGVSEPGILVLVAGRAWASKVLGGLAPLVLAGRELRCVDGGNCFDPYALSAHARLRGVDPALMLERVFLTRAFTIHQLEAVVTQMLPPLSARDPRPLVAVLGLDRLFLEESLPLRERRQVLERVVEALRQLRADGMTLLVTHSPLRGRPAWWHPLIGGLADCRGTVREGAGGLVEVEVEALPWAGR